jgi:hypothetical protein
VALILSDRVKVDTTTTGTGTIVLNATAPTGYQSFAVIGNANTTYYTIAGQTTNEWEVGIGTYYLANSSLSRTTILSSSNANAAVTFSAGTKDVFVTYPAEKSVNIDETGNVSSYKILGGTIDNAVIGGTTPAAGTFTLISNTRINPRISSTTSTATLTVNSDSFDQAVLTAQAVALSVAAPTGTPVNGQKLVLRFKDNATAQTISWTTTSGGFRVIGCTLPTTTVISKVIYVGCIYNSDETFWDVVSVGQQI